MNKRVVRLRPGCKHRLAKKDGGLGTPFPPGSILRVTEAEYVAFGDKFEDMPHIQVGAEVDGEHVEPIATPEAFRLAHQGGVNLAQVKGTGARGKIVAEDVLPHMPSTMQGSADFKQARIDALEKEVAELRTLFGPHVPPVTVDGEYVEPDPEPPAIPPATDAAYKLATEKDVDLCQIRNPTGSYGKITKADVQAVLSGDA
jgi:pyruvate/2-oxoglutarate dehydrogenase complex dihydrolipoamide acyltransferase (E2) component